MVRWWSPAALRFVKRIVDRGIMFVNCGGVPVNTSAWNRETGAVLSACAKVMMVCRCRTDEIGDEITDAGMRQLRAFQVPYFEIKLLCIIMRFRRRNFGVAFLAVDCRSWFFGATFRCGVRPWGFGGGVSVATGRHVMSSMIGGGGIRYFGSNTDP